MSDQCNQAFEQAARLAIQQTYGTEEGEFGSTLFVEHHMEELTESDWEASIGKAKPSPDEILDALECKLILGDDGAVEGADFGFPGRGGTGEVSQYLLAVSFDVSGGVEDISMES